MDVAESALGFCRKRGGRELILADAADVPLESASFDLITCTDVIRHLSDGGVDQRAVREMARLLKPGGVLYLRTNTKQGVLHSRYNVPTVRALRRSYNIDSEPIRPLPQFARPGSPSLLLRADADVEGGQGDSSCSLGGR